nr:hypothetical protein [Tanacetum cinerariifolium]
MTYHRQNLPSSMAKKLHYKLARVVSRHDHLKLSFKHLKTQIEIGLLEAEDVFSSLAVPLMTLVGLKSGDMAKQGRSTTFFITTGSNSYRDKSEDMTADVDMMSNGERECEVHKLEEYTNKVIMAGQELIDKQKMQLMQLMRLLKQVEGSVNSSQNSMIQNIDNHKDSLRTFLQKAVTYVSTIQHSSHDEHAFNITLKLIKAIYDHVCKILSSVEGGVDNLINRLAEQMCQPMMEYVKSLKAEMTTGTCPRLLGKIEDMKKVMRDGRVELEQARKKVRLAEERKLEALSRLKESEENLKKMRQYMGLSTNDKNESTGHYSKNKLLAPVEDQAKEDKLFSVEGGVDNLINRLAEQMCQPMMAYVKSFKAEMTIGTCPRLLGTSEDMRKATRDERVELEQARKKVRLAEQRKLEAPSMLKKSEEKLKK